MTLVSVTAYHSFGGEVEASNTPTIRRLTPSCRHQLSPIALGRPASSAFNLGSELLALRHVCMLAGMPDWPASRRAAATASGTFESHSAGSSLSVQSGCVRNTTAKKPTSAG